VIISIEGDVEAADARVTVVLGLDRDRFYGQAIGDADPQHRARLAGEATLRAVEGLPGVATPLELLAVATTDLGGARIALAQVQVGGGDVLVGSALIRSGDPGHAAVRAVMDALNRRLGTL
jgi:hypothetical protein